MGLWWVWAPLGAAPSSASSLLGMRFSPLPLGRRLMLLSKTHLGRAEFVPGARLGVSSREVMLPASNSPMAVCCHRAPGC